MMSSLGGSSSSRQSGQHQFQDTFPGSHRIVGPGQTGSRPSPALRLEVRDTCSDCAPFQLSVLLLFFFFLTPRPSFVCLSGPYAVLTKDTMPQTYKRKRSWSRAVFSNLQRKGLEKRFEIQKYVTKPDRKQLAAMLGLTDAQVRSKGIKSVQACI